MTRFERDIVGKDIIAYTSKSGKIYSPDDIGMYLKKFKLYDALILIGELSHRIFRTPERLIFIKHIPISDSVLAYLSMRLIENSNDYRSKNMTVDNLLTAIDMFFGLLDPIEKDSDNAQGCLIRFGLSQFDYNREASHLLPRTLIIYGDLWNTAVNANQVDINAAIQSFSGLTLQEILLLSIFFSGTRSKQGCFCLDENILNYPDVAKIYFNIKKQESFVNWISCSYSDFRSELKENKPPSIEYEKFRFNPLNRKPVIVPDRNINPGSPQVYITPIPTLIYEKSTRGIYFSLADYFRSGKHNPFLDAFGYVFQEYVGLLLKKAIGEDNVKQEWKYGSKRTPKDTPDWFVIQNGVAVLIEVKKSGLYLEAKQWGETEKIRKDVERNIGRGVNQMWEFEHDVKNGLCSVPDWFNSIEITERVVVTYDRSYFLNSFLRDEVRLRYPSISKEYHWHTIAVEELEYFLGITGKSFIEALTEKRLDVEGDSMDFGDYYSRKYSKDDCRNSYLDSIYSKFFDEVSLSSKKSIV